MQARFPTWKIAALVAGAALVLLVGFIVWVESVASRRWAELQQRVPVLIAEARAREKRRPVLRGEALPGNAWDDYAQALAAITGLKTHELREFVNRTPKADRAKAEATVAAFEGCLAHVSTGAQRAEGTYPLNYEKGFEANLPYLWGATCLAELTACKARFLAEAKRPQEAISLLLDGLQFSLDLGRNTMLTAEMGSWLILKTVMDELKDVALDPLVKDVAWADLARALERLDEGFPNHGESLLAETAVYAASASQKAMGNLLEHPELWSQWRFGFSGRIVLADAVRTHEAWSRRAAKVCRGTWIDLGRMAGELEGLRQSEKNPILKNNLPNLFMARAGLERRAQLRLLRMAVGLRASGALKPLEDPFGGKLHGDSGKLWSVGPDGVDDGGVGYWQHQHTGDIVLNLPKR